MHIITTTTNLKQDFRLKETFFEVVRVNSVVFIQEQRPRVFRDNVIGCPIANASLHTAEYQGSCSNSQQRLPLTDH